MKLHILPKFHSIFQSSLGQRDLTNELGLRNSLGSGLASRLKEHIQRLPTNKVFTSATRIKLMPFWDMNLFFTN